MVVYERGIREGVSVHQRRTILKLPNVTQMQIKARVHESVVSQVKSGQSATVRLDARPNKSYRGSVESISVLPERSGWLNSDVKWYESVIAIEGEVQGVRPGMTAVVEIQAARLDEVLLAPVEAFVEIDGDDWCYVEAEGGVERRMVRLGDSSDEFVQIRGGLDEGDRVALNAAQLLAQFQSRERSIGPDGGLSDILR
jgi:hypothetical protein